MASFDSDLKGQSVNLFADKLLFFIFLFCMLSALVQSLLILTAVSKLPPQIPLFYSKTWGNEMLAPVLYIWILPAITVSVYFLNMFVCKFVTAQDKFLIGALFISSAVVATATFWDTSKIISLLI